MLHVMHVIDSLAVGGAERMLVEIANQTARDGHRVSVCVTRSACDLAGELDERIELLVLERKRRFDWKALRRFGGHVAKSGVDLFHGHGRSTFSFLATARALRLVRQPVLLHDHAGKIEYDESIPLWFRVGARWYLESYVGVCDRHGSWAHRAGVAGEQIRVIYNALNLDRIGEGGRGAGAPGRPEAAGPVGVLVAGLRPQKGIEVLLDALSQMAHRGPFQVLIAGGSLESEYGRACRERCARLGLDGRVRFLGVCRDVPALLREADFALLSSHSESGPLVLIEYMAAGLPFVSTRVGSVGSQVEALGIGEFVPPGDAGAFAGALERLLALDPEARRARGEAARAVAREHFAIRNVIHQWYAVYRRMLGVA